MNIPILMYHEIIDPGADNRELLRAMEKSYFVNKNSFEEQLAYLRKKGYKTISLNELVENIKNPSASRLPEKSVILTFDDGYAGNYKYALPLLVKYNLSAVFFITAGLVGTKFMMGWDDLRSMVKQGMSIQSHTMTHPFLRQLSDKAVARELRGSKEELEKNLDIRVDFISVPHGSFGTNYRAIAAENGFSGGCCSKIGLNNFSTDIYLLKRIHISSKYNIEKFRKIVSGDPRVINKLMIVKSLKSAVRKVLGEKLYFAVYKIVFGVRQQKRA